MHRLRWFPSLVAAVIAATCAADTRPPQAPLPDDPSPSGPVRRALLVGIDDYESQVPVGKAAPPGRGFRNLHGAARDARALREMLVERFGFAHENVLVLTDAQATRENILSSFQNQLIGPAGPGDTIVFYFGGHGSQRRNSLTDELDKLDETLVPVDAGRNVPDIRDKELRPLLNALLDRGARPTILLDSCHSGSGARGYPTELEPRALGPMLSDIADPGPFGPDPAERGALVLSAARANEFAWETLDDEGEAHGAFSWALLQALRDVVPGEAAEDTFQRVRSRLHSESRRQEPVLEGTETVRRAPLFAAVGDPAAPARPLVAVERVEADGSLILQAGWVHGLSEGSQVRWTSPEGQRIDLEIVQMLGLSRCRARPLSSAESSPMRSSKTKTPSSGTLLEITGWAAPSDEPLRVLMPTGNPTAARKLATDLANHVSKRGIGWVTDPAAESPTHLLRPRDSVWELISTLEPAVALGVRPSAEEVLRHLPRGSRLFVQIPAPAALVPCLKIGPGTPNDGIEPTLNPTNAAAVLVGRSNAERIEYAWVRPDSAHSDSALLPAATPWRDLDSAAGAQLLRDDLFHLRKLHGWLSLVSPPSGEFGYRLTLRKPGQNASLGDQDALRPGELLDLVLEPLPQVEPARLRPRYVYVFLIDSQGNSVLLFGLKTDDNPQPFRFDPKKPLAPHQLGSEPLVHVVPPLGRDYYVLLTSDEPLPNPWVLEYRFRARGPHGVSALEELLSITGGTTRSAERPVTAANWSIERRSFVSR